VTDGRVEIRYVIPTTTSSTKTQFCHLRTDYFDPVASPVGDPVEARPAALVRLGGDHRSDPTAAQQPPRTRIRVPLVPGQLGRPRARPTPARPSIGPGPLDRPTIQQRLQLGDLMTLTWSGQDHQWAAAPVGAQVQLGAQPAPTAPKRLILRADDPLFKSS
jgi:hypothetical protein